MATNLALDDELLKAAQLLGHHTTKKDAVTTAPREYIQGLRLKEFLPLAGTRLSRGLRSDGVPKACKQTHASVRVIADTSGVVTCRPAPSQAPLTP